MKPKVFAAMPIDQTVQDYIEQYCELDMWDCINEISRAALLDEIKDVEGLLLTSSTTTIDKELLNNAPLLKVVSNASVGYNNFDLTFMKERGIIGTNTPGVLNDTVADLIFGLILTSARRIAEFDSYVKRGQWTKAIDQEGFGVDVHHATLGIIGMGRIGEEIARRARLGFKMNVLYCNRHRKSESERELGVEFADLSTLLAQSDFVVMMTPLTKDTFHLIGAEEFARMKQSAIFINGSRGETIDEQALIDALLKRKIRGAGLDVFEHEPVNSNNPLLSLPNVITLPHLGSATDKCRLAMAMLAAKNLVAGVTGTRPENIVQELI